MAGRYTYSRWDGTQKGFDLDADSLLEELTDDLLYHGDVNAALRRLMQQGMTDRNGEQMMGCAICFGNCARNGSSASTGTTSAGRTARSPKPSTTSSTRSAMPSRTPRPRPNAAATSAVPRTPAMQPASETSVST